MTTSPTLSAPPPARILVIRLGAVGDVVRTLPAVRLLRRTWPEARLAWAVERGPAPLLEGHPDIDELLVLERRTIVAAARRLHPGALATLRRFRRTLRRFAPELSVDFQSSFKSGLVAWMAGAPRRVGFDRADAREASHLFATERTRLPRPRISRVERAAHLARAAGAAGGPLVVDLALGETERKRGRERVRRLAGGRPAIALAPFSSRRQAWKRYPLDRWAAIAGGLAAAGACVLVLHGPGDEAAEAAALCSAAGRGVSPLGGGGLRDLAADVAAADLLVGGDTGPMHLAWASGVPVVALYGPTDPVLNAPYGPGHVVLAPPERTDRHARDRFPGLTPGLVVERALARLGVAAEKEVFP
jgi:lipopolysaccharide heptosyltransferase I